MTPGCELPLSRPGSMIRRKSSTLHLLFEPIGKESFRIMLVARIDVKLA
jgi:hypothetical protein